MIYDISVPIENGMHVWPSDPPIRLEAFGHASKDRSHRIQVTSICCGSHTGTHLDAPSHMIEGSSTLGDIPLEALIGPARVIHATGVESIDRATLERSDWKGVERVVFRTENSAHWLDPTFYESFVYLQPDAARFLVSIGIRLIGIDYLSIDSYMSVDHASHVALLSKSIVILEGLNLSGVPEGDYQLVALPMKLTGADGAPVRAVLIN